MPAVIDAPEVVTYKEQDLQEEQPQGRAAHPGFWQRVQQYVQPSSSPRTRQPIETPAELLARTYPTLYMRAFGGI
jgi:hypothetical protein